MSNRSSESDTSTNSGSSLDSDTSSIETAEEEDSGGDEASDKIRDLGTDDYMSTEDQIHTGSAKFSGRVFFILGARTSIYIQ